MDKILAIVNALNGISPKDFYIGETGVGIYLRNEKNEVVSTYFIKPRPVADNKGVEHWKFVAREEK